MSFFPLPRSFLRAFTGLVAVTCAFVWTGPALAISIARDTEVEEYLWDQLRPIFKVAGLDANAIKIYLVNDPAVNAFATGGQMIFVNTGIIDRLETPNQLLGVLAHETGHVAAGHAVTTGDNMMNEAAPFLIVMLAGLAAMLAGEGQAGLGIITGAQQAMQRAMLGFNRAQESATDQAAIKYLEKIGKSGRGMVETFEIFAQQELLTARMQDPYARSHPAGPDRIAALSDRVEKSQYAAVPDTEEDKYRYAMIQAKLRGFTDYVATTLRRYPTSDTSDPARYARAVAYYRSPDFAAANAEIDALIAKHSDNPYFWELKGQILAEMRDFRGAASAFEKSMKLKPRAPLLEVNLGATLVAMDDPKLMPKARDILTDALRREPTNAFAWLQLSFAYAALGNEGMAALALAEQRFNLGAYGDAVRFAMRARHMLPKGSREAGRADDIVVIAQANMPKDGDKGGRRGRFTLEPSHSHP